MPTVCRLVVYALFAFALLFPAAGDASAATPTVIDPADGGSVWSYSDAHDAAPKREGGYLEFNRTGGYSPDGADYSIGGGSYDQADYVGRGPHGGYDTSTNKCSACHSVHRAEGAYYLTRADNPDDACAYCHIGASPFSSLAVYTANPAGVQTANGHTMGAGPDIPDSTTGMGVEEIELVEGRPETTVTIRRYTPERKLLYRIVGYTFGSAGSPDVGGEPRFARVGPERLTCSSCHHTHGSASQLWRPQAYDETYEADAEGFLTSGYKLLRRFPGATVVGDPAPGAPFESVDLAKVPESRLLADVNYSTTASLETTYTENGETYRQPDWIAQELSGETTSSAGVVNQFTLSVWCADCHNLNIGSGYTQSADGEPDAGRAHSDRTHTVPGIAAFGGASGGSQCYSCHRNDLGYGTSCSRCHYTPQTYRQQIAGSDFPHSGSDDSRALLGAFSIEIAPDAARWSDFSYVDAVITEDNTDAVCLRCHAVRHPNYGSSPPDHTVPADYAECTGCHLDDAAEIHNATTSGCDACHSAATLTFDCGTCHPDELEPHGYEIADHTATLGSGEVLIFAAETHEPTITDGDLVVEVECVMCHTNDLGAAHGMRCATCHPSPRDSLGTWTGGCQEGGCHPTYHGDTVEAHWHTDDPSAPPYYGDCDNCHFPSWAPIDPQTCLNCHTAYSASDTSPPTTTSDAQASYLGPALVEFSITDGGKIGVGTTFHRLDGASAKPGSEVFVTAPGSHTLEYWSVDQAGNVEPTRHTTSFTVTADTEAPVTTSNAQPLYYSATTITLTASDASYLGVKTTYYTLNGGAVQTGTRVPIPGSSSGEVDHTLTFWSEDWSGNVEAPSTVDFTVTGGAGTLRLIWGGGPGPDSDAYWTITRAGMLPISGYSSQPGWDGIDDVVVPVSPFPYLVSVDWWNDDGYYDNTTFANVYVLTAGQIINLAY